jgi:hypothetical protein
MKRKGSIGRLLLAFGAATAMVVLAGGGLGVAAQEHPSTGAQPLAIPPLPGQTRADFLKATDEVLGQMSEILHLPPKGELKKSIRTREEIRQYVLKDFEQEKEKEGRLADELLSKKLGLIPEDLDWEPFLLDLLTEQIAGLYDPKTREFYIADWIEPGDQREVMAHELTHALQDEHFSIEKWADAAKPNDDAEFARHAVLEGSAFAAMMDWQYRDRGLSVRELPDLEKLMDPDLMTGGKKDSKFDQAPQFIRDVLLFPYLSGAVFTQKLLQEYDGWTGFNRVFEHPPASTQQILHPDLYLRGLTPVTVELPALPAGAAGRWKKLEASVGGEFLLLEWLKEFCGPARAKELAAAWTGDRYAIYAEAKPARGAKTPRALLLWRIATASDAEAARLFGGMSQALQMRYEHRAALLRRPNYFEFQTPQGGVFLRCLAAECLVVDGADRALYDELTRAMGWPAAPVQPRKTEGDEIAWVPVASPVIGPGAPALP